MRTFRLGHIDYSLEEAVAIEGFVGYVHCIKGDNVLGVNAVCFDKKGRPLPVIAVCFTRPK